VSAQAGRVRRGFKMITSFDFLSVLRASAVSHTEV